jgi:hypothetical protein
LRTLAAEISGGEIRHGSVFPSWGKFGVGDDLRTEVAEDPDDFLNWPYYIDTYPSPTISERDFLDGIYNLRNGLVAKGIRVWIVTDLEHMFPPGWTPDN